VPHLDGDFTVFGEVYSGMSVIDKIATQSTDAYDRPREDLFITVEIIE
jgi:peptidyl-prolyl cis-trans isomerase B (cyclophilin B)